MKMERNSLSLDKLLEYYDKGIIKELHTDTLFHINRKEHQELSLRLHHKHPENDRYYSELANNSHIHYDLLSTSPQYIALYNRFKIKREDMAIERLIAKRKAIVEEYPQFFLDETIQRYKIALSLAAHNLPAFSQRELAFEFSDIAVEELLIPRIINKLLRLGIVGRYCHPENMSTFVTGKSPEKNGLILLEEPFHDYSDIVTLVIPENKKIVDKFLIKKGYISSKLYNRLYPLNP